MLQSGTARSPFKAPYYSLTAPWGQQSILSNQELQDVLETYEYKIKGDYLVVYFGNDMSLEVHITPTQVSIQ